jgi:D-hexose-6-phosphate mutarotase
MITLVFYEEGSSGILGKHDSIAVPRIGESVKLPFITTHDGRSYWKVRRVVHTYEKVDDCQIINIGVVKS